MDKEGTAPSTGTPNRRPAIELPESNSHTLNGRDLAVTVAESCNQQETCPAG